MTKMPNSFKYQKQIWAMSGTIAMLVCTYIVLIGTTFYNTLERQRAEKSIANITGELSEMEFSYLNLKARVNPEMARSLGFVDVSNVIVAKSSANVTAFVAKSKI
jgi:hypothetical protein